MGLIHTSSTQYLFQCGTYPDQVLQHVDSQVSLNQDQSHTVASGVFELRPLVASVLLVDLCMPCLGSGSGRSMLLLALSKSDMESYTLHAQCATAATTLSAGQNVSTETSCPASST